VKPKTVIAGILKYAIGFGLLAFVIWRSWDDKVQPNDNVIPGLKTVLQKSPDWANVALAAGLIAMVMGLQFYRWYLLVKAVGLPFTKWNALRLGLVGYFYNIFLPGAIGGDLVKAFFIARDHPTRKPVAVATVLIDRVLGLFGLVLLASVVGGIGWANGDDYIRSNEYLKTIIRVTGLTAGVIGLGWVLLGWMPEHRKNKFEDRLHRLKPRKLGQTLAELWFAIRTYRQRSKVIYVSVAISAAAHIGMVLLYHVCVRVFPLEDPATLAEHAVIAPIGYIAQVFFPVPGGVGGAEAIFGFLYTLLGRPESTGVIGRLTLRVFEWSVGLMGYLMFLNMKKELNVEKVERHPSQANSTP
jgi:hypothetical protein